MKIAFAFAAIVSGAAAFSAKPAFRASTALNNGPVKGAGGMHDTRDPAPFQHEDPRKSISAAPSFEEYMKQRAGGAAPAPAAPAPAAPAPVAYSPPPAAYTPPPAAYTPPPAPAPAPAAHSGPVKGAGGMHDTRDPAPFQHEDPRKSISAAPSFEEYMKQRAAGN